MASPNLKWQSQAVLLAVLPAAAVDLVLQSFRWAANAPVIAITALGLSALLGLVAWKLHSATPAGAATGFLLTASLMLATSRTDSLPWQTALVPVFAVLVLASLTTHLGRARKERLGTAEPRTGRVAAQVAANIGAATLLSTQAVQLWMADSGRFSASGWTVGLLYAPMLAALSEAAADTVSSELGQLLDSRPRMITTLRLAPPGADGAISPGGTAAGVLAAGIVASAGTLALRGGLLLFIFSWIGGVFGLLFDSLLGATLERRGWLNNDAVNFLSTLSSAACALLLLALAPRIGLLEVSDRL